MPYVLIIEDDPELGPLLAEYLAEEGMRTSVEADGARAVHRIVSEQPDLVLLDINLPGMDGFEVHRAVRPLFRGVILVLSARRADLDQVAALEMGADDYVTKPVDPRVLFARIKAHLRRVRLEREQRDVEPARRTVGQLTLDRVTRAVHVGSVSSPMTSLEFDLLWALARAAGTVVSRDRLSEDVLGTKYDGMDRGVDSHLSRVRRKLREAGIRGDPIRSVRGQGYQLVPM